MVIVEETDERTTRTPAATMVGLAAPSQGSRELCTWRVLMDEGKAAPPHLIDREQVWMPLSGKFEFTVDGETSTVSAGQALVVPAGTTRNFQVTSGPGEALVCMVAGGTVTPQGAAQSSPIPWAV